MLDQCQPSQINPVFSSSLRSRVEYLRAPLPATQDNAISSVQPESPCSLITSFLTSKPRCPLRTGVCCPMQGWRRPCTVRAGVFSVALHSSSPRAGLTPASLHCSPPHTHAPSENWNHLIRLLLPHPISNQAQNALFSNRWLSQAFTGHNITKAGQALTFPSHSYSDPLPSPFGKTCLLTP